MGNKSPSAAPAPRAGIKVPPISIPIPTPGNGRPVVYPRLPGHISPQGLKPSNLPVPRAGITVPSIPIPISTPGNGRPVVYPRLPDHISPQGLQLSNLPSLRAGINVSSQGLRQGNLHVSKNKKPSGGKRYKKRTRKNCMHKKRTHKRKH